MEVLLQMIPPVKPFLGSLEVLQLVYMEIDAFPSSLAATFERLTELKLSHNHFTQLPSSLTLITTLQSLDMSYNDSYNWSMGLRWYWLHCPC
jgi:Leucine-rich repeat (LRR) protein